MGAVVVAAGVVEDEFMNYVFKFTVITILLAACASSAVSQNAPQTSFASPEEAAAALLSAVSSQERGKLIAMFGPTAESIMSSGDPVQDKIDRGVFLVAMKQSTKWEAVSPVSRSLIVGQHGWPFPIPLVKKGSGWTFDTAAGAQEILNRRIGNNELTVIGVCRMYPNVQKIYASMGRDSKPAGIYAQKIRSDKGRQNGLYWQTSPGEPASPLGDLAAEASKEGYDREKDPTTPVHGYYFRILTEQGPAANGGAKNYITAGDMTGGFALVAYPAKYRNSGVMTFIVGADGVVFEKDLGKETENIAAALKSYNPDRSWRRVN